MKIDYRLFGKGMLMGAADIVPGVSGGTIAFITGIYERLIYSLQSIIPSLIQLIKDRKLTIFWLNINGSFLSTLLAGILTSVILLASVITHLLAEYPIPIWAFFFGLIVASLYIVFRQISHWNFRLLVILGVSAAFAWLVTSIAPANLEENYFNIFISGMIAICAMILPGISGSFILVILGTYTFVLTAIKEFDILLMAVFASGCFIGLLCVANVLAWAFSKYKNEVLASLTGFMVGSLNKVWPWREVLSVREGRHGQMVPQMEVPISPAYYETLTGMPSHGIFALTCAILACGAILFFERMANAGKQHNVQK